MKFRKKQVVIDAIQWDGRNVYDVYCFITTVKPDIRDSRVGERWNDYVSGQENKDWHIKTLEDGPNGEVKHVASVGDWIIRGVKGEVYPCKPDIFEATYDSAE